MPHFLPKFTPNPACSAESPIPGWQKEARLVRRAHPRSEKRKSTTDLQAAPMIKAAQGRIHTLACLKGIPVHRRTNTPFDLSGLHSSGTLSCKINQPGQISITFPDGDCPWRQPLGTARQNCLARSFGSFLYEYSSDTNAPWDATEGIVCLRGGIGRGGYAPCMAGSADVCRHHGTALTRESTETESPC